MSYQVLARKWRPTSFAEVAGQQHVLQALSNGLDQNRLHHAYLLTGTRGVGKTTIARILARCFNCEEGVSSTPCGSCSSCTEIAEGRSVDLIEIDAASRTKVEDMRELLENVQYMPTRCKFKIYLIDEVHMLTQHSFNALLKTLEEPPVHAIFLFATTHPQKLPPTVLSRCLQFHLKNLTSDLIVEHLRKVLEQESITFDEPGLHALAFAASGSMRDALSLTDQAIAFGQGSVLGEAVNDMLGTVDTEMVTRLLSAIFDADGARALALITEYGARTADFNALIDELTSLLHRIAVEQAAPGAGREGRVQREYIGENARKISPQDIQLYYQILLTGKRDIHLAPDPLSGMEMIIVRLLAFQLAQPEELHEVSGADRIADVANDQVNTEQAVEGKKKILSKPESVDPALRSPAADTERSVNQPSANIEPSAYKEPSANKDLIAQKHPKTEKVPPVQVASQPEAQPGINESTPDLAMLDAVQWCRIFSMVPLSGIVRTVASYCVPSGVQGDRVCFSLDESNATLYSSDHCERIATGLSIYYGTPVTVNISVEPCDTETPAEYRRRIDAEKKEAALQSLQSDESVQAILDTFDATIDIDTVQATTEKEHAPAEKVHATAEK